MASRKGLRETESPKKIGLKNILKSPYVLKWYGCGLIIVHLISCNVYVHFAHSFKNSYPRTQFPVHVHVVPYPMYINVQT